MDKAAEDQPILRRVGRPKKIKPEVSVTVEEFLGPLTGQPRTLAADSVAIAQEYANRVWAGQSISESRAWRLQRVKEALEGQGYSMEGVIL